MKHVNPPFLREVTAIALFCAAAAVPAQTATGATTGTATTTQQNSPAPATASTPTNKLVSTFTPMAGSGENAGSMVNGLRTGSAITLTSTPGGAPGGESVTFTPPTRPMGYGNIRIAMSLAEAQLASQGITNPTPTQLQGALMGTTTTGPGGTTTTQGILQMRASGMGWGKIAQSMGYKLGPIMSGKQTFTATAAAGGTATTAAGTTTHGRSGVTTAGGGSVNAGGHGKSQVVTAAGGGGGQVTTGLGHGNSGGASSGVVSAAGGKGGGGAQGAGNGKGGGKP